VKSQVLTIAAKEFSDRFRSGWVIGCIVVWLAAVCLTSFFGLIQIGKIGFQGYERTVLSLLNLVQYLVPLLALLIGHDLLVGEKEERTLAYLVASGVSRGRVVLGKYIGVGLALTFSLLLGFGVAGAAIGYGARDRDFGSFAALAISGLGLGLIFAAIAIAISSLSRSRVQALVFSLLVWGGTVFAFDLIALGALVSFVSPAAQKEIDIICDPMHVNAVAADVHAAFDAAADGQQQATRQHPVLRMSWLWINPVDLFRSVNLQRYLKASVPWPIVPISAVGWIAAALVFSERKLRKADL
jgi:Cu-processing system permease protein